MARFERGGSGMAFAQRLQRAALAWPPWLRAAWPALALWALAFLLRAWLAGGPGYGDESAHFAVSRDWGRDPTNVVPEHRLFGSIWWQRPLFSVLLWPGAALGFEAYRFWHAALASLLPVAASALTRRWGLPTWLAVGAGAAIAVHPTFVLWGARVFPDSIMGALALFGLERFLARRWVASAALLLAATWVKEVAAVLLLACFAVATWRAVRSGAAKLYPLQADHAMTALGAVGVLAPLPLANAIVGHGGRLPGWSTSPLSPTHLDGVFVSVWLLGLILAGLAVRTVRGRLLWAFVFPAFYVAYGALGKGFESWYAVLPAALSVCAAAVAIWAFGQRSQRVGKGLAVAAASVVLVAALLPASIPLKVVAAPLSDPSAGLVELAAQAARPGDLEDVVAHMDSARGDWQVVFLVDPGWFHVAHPFAARATSVGQAYTDLHASYGEWADAMDQSDAVVLLKVERPMNQALRATYADCVGHENPSYVLLRAKACPDRADALRAQHARLLAAAAT